MEKSTFIFISEFPQTPPVSPSSGKKTYAETDSKANNPCWFRILRHQSKLKTIFQFTGGSTRMSRIKDKCHNITRDGAKMQWFDQISNIVWSSGWHSCRAQTPTRGRKQHHLIFSLNLKLVKNNLHNFKKLFPTSFLCPLSGKSVQTCSSETRQTLYIWKRTNKSRSSIYNYIWMNRHIWIHNPSNLEYSDFRNISTHPAFIPALHSCTFMRSARQ